MTFYRTIVETSCMINNDEHTFYSKEQHERGTTLPGGRNLLDTPRVVLCRPVYDEEVREGLDVNYAGEAHEENVPEVTQLLDSYYRLKEYFQMFLELGFLAKKDPDPAAYISEYVAGNYYDCMSGGMPHFDMIVLRHLLNTPGSDLKEPVYPGKIESSSYEDFSTWYTLEDFIKACDELHNVEDFSKVLARLKDKLPPFEGFPQLGA